MENLILLKTCQNKREPFFALLLLQKRATITQTHSPLFLSLRHSLPHFLFISRTRFEMRYRSLILA